jgi:hypothetical protein
LALHTLDVHPDSVARRPPLRSIGCYTNLGDSNVPPLRSIGRYTNLGDSNVPPLRSIGRYTNLGDSNVPPLRRGVGGVESERLDKTTVTTPKVREQPQPQPEYPPYPPLRKGETFSRGRGWCRDHYFVRGRRTVGALQKHASGSHAPRSIKTNFS